MSKVKDFLEEVAKSREEFDKKIESVKNRFDTLRSGTKELKRNLEALDKKLEQEKIASITKIEDLEKEILLEQNKRPDIRKRLEGYEREINFRSDREKQSNENLIKKHKESTQVRLAIDHLCDFMAKFSEITIPGDSKGTKPGTIKFQGTIQGQEKKKDKSEVTSEEIKELENQVMKLKKIKKQALFWNQLYRGDMSAFNQELLYEEIKDKKKQLGTQMQSPTKKKAENTTVAAPAPATKEVTVSGITEVSRK